MAGRGSERGDWQVRGVTEGGEGGTTDGECSVNCQIRLRGFGSWPILIAIGADSHTRRTNMISALRR